MDEYRYALYPGYLWKNIKTGKVYTILFLAMNATNASNYSQVVVYEEGDRKFVRDADEFLTKFTFVSAGPVLVPSEVSHWVREPPCVP